MSILDLFKSDKTEALVSHGVTGTEILSGILTTEYNPDLHFPKSIEVYDTMRKSDGTVIAILRAMKSPLVSAKWQVQSGGEDVKDKTIADFVTHNLFEKIKFKHFLRESLGFLDFGFYYFEKNYEIVGGNIEWKEFSPRIPSSHYLWGLQSGTVSKPVGLGNQTEWIDGHPPGVTQMVNRSDEVNDNTLLRQIPWEKIILFSYEREGNNFEGVSVLRNAYKHYFYKDLLYRIAGIAAERFGVGIPVAQVKNSMSTAKQTALAGFLKNIRTNEQSYGIYTDDVVKLHIMTPDGRGMAGEIKDIIEHHDKKIYDSILAGFLNLTSGDGGSNALSKDQSSFFLRGLQGIADFFIDTMNEHIRELVDLNFSGVESYPKLTVSDIGTISMDEQIKSILEMSTAGLLDITPDDKQMIRDILKMPRLTAQQQADIEKEKQVQAAAQAAIDAKAAQDAIDTKAIAQAKANPEKMSEVVFAEDKKKVPTPREVTFTNNITDFEGYLNDQYAKVLQIATDTEKQWRDTVTALYESSESTRSDGVVCLVYNKAKINAGKKKIQKITDAMTAQLIDSPIQQETFKAAKDQAKSTLADNDKLLGGRVIITGQDQIDSFIDGYKSNMQGVIYNDSRRVLEDITLNYGSEASVDLAKKSAASISINKNILSLSFITHPRAAYKFIIYNESQAEGFTLFKTIVPTNLLPNVINRPFGMTASMIFTIQTAAQINAAASDATAGKTAEATAGLGLHHGSFEYYYPISSADLPQEQAIAKQQQEDLQSEMDDDNEDSND